MVCEYKIIITKNILYFKIKQLFLILYKFTFFKKFNLIYFPSNLFNIINMERLINSSYNKQYSNCNFINLKS